MSTSVPTFSILPNVMPSKPSNSQDLECVCVTVDTGHSLQSEDSLSAATDHIQVMKSIRESKREDLERELERGLKKELKK